MRERLLESADAHLAWRPAALASFRRFSGMRVLIRAGEPASSVYLLRRGQVRTYLLSRDGRQTITSVLGAGQLVGISALLGHKTYHEFAETLGPVEAWVMPADQLLHLLPTDRDLLGLIVGALAQRLAQGVALLGELTLRTVTDRIDNVQELLSSQLGESPRLNKQSLADLIGARPESLSRAMHHGRAVARASVTSRPPARPAIPRAPASARPMTVIDAVADELAGCPVQAFAAGERLPISTLEGVVYVIRQGCVRLILQDTRGRQLIIEEMQSGQCFGLPPIARLHKSGLCAEALTQVSVWLLAPTDLLRLLDEYPHLRRRVVAQTAERLWRVEQLLHRAHAPTARARLASLLLELALREGQPRDNASYHIPRGWTHAALADAVGMRRETVSRTLRALSADGHVRRNGRRMVICDAERFALAFGLETV